MGSREEPRIIVALDFDSEGAAWAVAEELDPALCRLKVGKQLFVSSGPQVVRRLVEHGFDVFLDLKFHDIPNTVANACAAAADLGCWMVNVHAAGGVKMMQAAAERLAHLHSAPLLVAVTVLTSLEAAELDAVGFHEDPATLVARLARLTAEAGFAGVVCSPREITRLRSEQDERFCLVTPGIRPQGLGADDQQRIATPEVAIAAGADYLVIGRPITGAADPMTALDALHACVKEATD